MDARARLYDQTMSLPITISALICSIEGKLDEAIPHFQRALQINPDYAEAHNNLGATLFQKGKVDEAIPHFQEALRIKPDYAHAESNLGNALFKKGKVDEAISHYQESVGNRSRLRGSR